MVLGKGRVGIPEGDPVGVEDVMLGGVVKVQGCVSLSGTVKDTPTTRGRGIVYDNRRGGNGYKTSVIDSLRVIIIT